ncbi:fibropellin-1-like isoform X2 [Mytilus trossulus]|uniref:fibropellin-1-like isoform X2 n=1 Tax=Mytilus trossulus TaxID=6551 RepID=UPI00300423CE
MQKEIILCIFLTLIFLNIHTVNSRYRRSSKTWQRRHRGFYPAAQSGYPSSRSQNRHKTYHPVYQALQVNKGYTRQFPRYFSPENSKTTTGSSRYGNGYRSNSGSGTYVKSKTYSKSRNYRKSRHYSRSRNYRTSRTYRKYGTYRKFGNYVKSGSYVNSGNYVNSGSYVKSENIVQSSGASDNGVVPTVSTSATHQFTYGTTATLSCMVLASPAATSVSWSKYNSQNQLVAIDMSTNSNQKFQGSTVGSPSLIISNTVSGDAGRYVCSATNAAGTGSSGTTTLTITGEVPAVSTLATHQFTYGTTATLSCTVNANPVATSVSWSKYNSQNQLVAIDLSTNSNQKYQGSTVGSPSLIISNTVSGDAGRYVCSATNAVGTSSSGTTLEIAGGIPEVVIPLNQYSVDYGSSATIPCTVTANPTYTNVQWKIIVNGQEQNVDIQNAKYSGGTVNSPSLVIANAQHGDETFYICTASNIVGEGRSNQTFLEVGEKVCRLYCSNGGTLNSLGACVCVGGWTGTNCDVSPCQRHNCGGEVCSVTDAGQVSCGCCNADPCGLMNCNNGTCKVDPTTKQAYCECIGNFIGRNCEISPCDNPASSCFHGGSCSLLADGNITCSCPDGFSGDRCELSACRSGAINCGPGTCYTANRTAYCDCPPGFLGDRCQNDACSLINCNNGTCKFDPTTKQAYCECIGNFIGRNCEISPCENPASMCIHGGNCTLLPDGNITCSCPDGYSGSMCELSACSTGDINCGPGTCYTKNGNVYCDCPPGFLGNRCQNNACSLINCNNGTCKFDPTTTQAYCECIGNFIGRNCEISPCENPASMCIHGGNCTLLPDGNITCSCPDGYSGAMCELSACSTGDIKCGVGTCYTKSGNVYCDCPPGFLGNRCQNHPCSSVDCSGNGLCQFNSITGQAMCMCNGQYSGKSCEISPCNNPAYSCLNNGGCQVVNGLAKCNCIGGFTGDRCEQSPCTNHTNCGENGKCCVDDNGLPKCYCNPGYLGTLCTKHVCDFVTCSNHGNCTTSGDCVCDKKWFGKDCSNEVSPCGNDTCNGNGACEVVNGAAVCNCFQGWLTNNCSEHVCDNATFCSERGNCNRTTGECQCEIPWAGANCEVCNASKAVDVAFILDKTKSISATQFQQTKQAIVDTINILTIGKDDIRVAMVTFDVEQMLHFRFDVFDNRQDLIANITTIDQAIQGSTKIHGAVDFTRENVLAHQTNRPNVRDVIILLTDGQSKVGGSPATRKQKDIDSARRIKDDLNAVFISVGIGGEIDRDTLKQMASLPEYYIETDFDKLGLDLKRIIDKVVNCKED